MYARSGGRMLVSVARMYAGGPPDVCSANRTTGRTWDHQTYATFWKTLWIIPEHTRHPLDQCAQTTGRTLGLPDVCCFVRELVADFLYK
jgi:hypothetical protein